jgi:beta-lactam-binding protein with PASTA domain
LRNKMKSLTRYMLVIAMVGAMLSSIVGAAGAQEAEVGYLAAVNGASAEMVSVTAGPIEIGTDLAYAAPSGENYVPLETYAVEFTDGSTTSVVVSSQSAQTVVSGFGDDPDSAKAYPITIAVIPDGKAMVAFSNATNSPVDVTIGTDGPTTVQPGESIAPAAYEAGSDVTLKVDTAETTIEPGSDSYTDAFAVDDGTGVAIATSEVAKMTDLIAELAPPAADKVEVPDVVGQTEAEAISAITGVGLAEGTSQESSDTVAVGIVISQDPAATTMVDSGSTVTIVVSTGPDTTTIPVPDVVGQPEGDAQKTLEEEPGGFTVTSTEEPSADVEIGLVISTNPSAGTEVAPGTEVAMVVSSGPGDVVVPDLLGMTAAEATMAVEAAGLTISVVQDPDNPDPDGVVVQQDPAAGTTVEGGSEVVAQLSPDLGEPWAIVHLDPNRLMTVAGIGMLPGSTVNLSIIDTDLTESVAVQDDGSWSAKFDLSEVDNDTEFLLVKGTAADTNDYEATFKIPAAGGTTEVPTAEVPEEDSGFPLWGWILIGIALIAIVLIIVRMVQGGSDDTTGGTEAGATDAS